MPNRNELDFSINLALGTGNILTKQFKQQGVPGLFKKDSTLVTDADYLANNYITSNIKKQYPNDTILSEEGITTLTNVPERLWVIDPLDGTTNFSLGFSLWSTSIALIINGLPYIGIVYFPIINELYSAVHTKGARLNNVNLPNNEFRPIHVLSHCSRAKSIYNIPIEYKCRIWGSATYDLCSVASGKSAVSLDVSTKIWDIAASYLIIKESGREIKFLTHDRSDPFPIQPYLNYESIIFPVLAAINHEQLNKVFQTLNHKTGE